jgi:hypothetical protein
VPGSEFAESFRTTPFGADESMRSRESSGLHAATRKRSAATDNGTVLTIRLQSRKGLALLDRVVEARAWPNVTVTPQNALRL